MESGTRGPVAPEQIMSRKRSGRLRAYAVQSNPKSARRAIRFKCRHCGQKVLVAAKLARTAITCPTCEQLVPAPQPGRFWLEICGGVFIFLIGVAVGHSTGVISHPQVRNPASAIQRDGTEQVAPPRHLEAAWLANEEND